MQTWPVENGFLTPASWVAHRAVFAGMLWLFGVIVLTKRAAVIAMVIRRRLRAPASSSGPGLTLEELPTLRDRSDLTVPEYEALKGKMVTDLRISNAIPSTGAR